MVQATLLRAAAGQPADTVAPKEVHERTKYAVLGRQASHG